MHEAYRWGNLSGRFMTVASMTEKLPMVECDMQQKISSTTSMRGSGTVPTMGRTQKDCSSIRRFWPLSRMYSRIKKGAVFNDPTQSRRDDGQNNMRNIEIFEYSMEQNM